jgi:tetratricopeptide (TPR) repeat protein
MINPAFFLILVLTGSMWGWQPVRASQPTDTLKTLAQVKPIDRRIRAAQMLTVYQPLQHLQWEGQKVNARGIAYFPIDNFDVTSISESDLSIARSSHDPHKLAQTLAKLGLSHQIQGEFDRAIAYYREGLEIAKNNSDRELKLIILGNIGLAHVQSGDYSAEAIDYLQAYLQLTAGSSALKSQALGNLGNAYFGADLYVKAIETHQSRLKLTRQIQDRAGTAKTLSDLGIIYQALGDPNKAIEYQQQALNIAQQLANRSISALALANLGIIYQSQSNYPQAAKYHQQRLEIAHQLQDLPGEAEALANLGGVAYFQGDYPKAIELYEQGWKIAWNVLHDAEILYRIRGNQGLVYAQMGNAERAMAAYQEYYRYAYSRSSRREEGIAKINAAAMRFQAGDLAGAAKGLRAAIEVWESLRARLGSNDGFKISIFDSQNTPYSNLQSVLVAQKLPDTALEISERGRARAFAELLDRRLAAISKVKATPRPPLSSPSIAQIKQIARNHRATLVEYSIIPGNFNVGGKLETHDAELLIWIVQPTGSVTLRRVDLQPLWQCPGEGQACPQTLSNLVAIGRKHLLELDSGNGNGKPLQRLHQLLIQPIADLLPPDPSARVTFIPQSSLFILPFAALEDASGKFLIERHTISIAPSIQVLDLTDRQSSGCLPHASCGQSYHAKSYLTCGGISTSITAATWLGAGSQSDL